MSGRPSRDKGARREREVVALHTALGVKAERVPLSGASRYQGNGADVDVYAFDPNDGPLVCEVKARASGEGFVTLESFTTEERRVIVTLLKLCPEYQHFPPAPAEWIAECEAYEQSDEGKAESPRFREAWAGINRNDAWAATRGLWC